MSVSLLLYPLICAASVHGPQSVFDSQPPLTGPLDAIEQRIDRRMEQRLGEVADGLEGKASGTVGGVWAEVIVRIVAAIKKIVGQLIANTVDSFITELWGRWKIYVYSGVGSFLLLVGGVSYGMGRLGRRA